MNDIWKDFKKRGKNLQGYSLESPNQEDTLVLTLVSLEHEIPVTHAFKVTNALEMLLNRETTTIFYGSTCDKCGKKIGVELKWK
jgi:hypothetical protein